MDPWGESGPVDQATADAALSPAQRRRLLSFPTYGDPDAEPVEFVDAYARLATSLSAQLEFVDALIAREYATEGVDALRVKEQTAVVTGPMSDQSVEYAETGKESLRALVEWQGQLQARLASVLERGIKIGIKARQADLVRRYGEWVAQSLESFSAELGVSWDDEATRRAAQRAILRTRAALGVGSTSPDAAGPALTGAERARVGLAGPARGTRVVEGGTGQ